MVFQSQGLLLAAWLVFTTCLLIGTTTAGFSCLSNPCVYGICMDDLNRCESKKSQRCFSGVVTCFSTYTCYCIDGYTGVHCQTNWDECWSSPCQNGGVCHDGVAAFNCTCPDGFTGEMCEENVDECSSNPCFNNGTCVDGANGYACHCYPGYSGVFCEIDIAVCNSSEEQRCQNGGVCIEGPGMMFSCVCTAGWAGKLCDLPINECASSPCQNGAACIDLHAGYTCACLFGYTGHNCEHEMSLCESNPCKNDALCLEEDDTSVCYCVPDYHGDRCQYQYDECQLGPGCKNGGTCVDGVDSYACSCPPYLTGRYCECLILGNEDELDCSYIRPEVTTTTAELPTYSVTIKSSTRHLDESTTTILPFPPITSSQVPTTTETIQEPSETISKSEVTTPETTSWTETTTEFLTPLTVTDKLHTITEMETSTEEATKTSETSLPTETVSITELTPLPKTESTTAELTSITTQETGVTEAPTFSTETLLTSEFTTSVHERPSTKSVSTEVTTETVESEISTFFTTSEHAVTYTEPNVTVIIPTTEEIFLSTLPSSITSSTFVTSFPKTILIPVETTPVTVETETSEVVFSTIPQELSTFNVTEGETTSVIAITEVITSEQETTPTAHDCTVKPCLNGGTCYISKDGSKCSCKFGWSGIQCEIHTGVYDAAFTGHSYLVHRLSNTSGTVIGIRVRTLAPTGLLMCAHTVPHIFMAVYVQNGLLKFLFSCGIQTMLFSELHERINTGFHHHIVAIVEVVPSINKKHHCMASLKVNNSLTMSGEQKAMDISPVDWHAHLPVLYLGGLPKHLLHFVDIPVKTGITGCMQGLQIDGNDRSIYSSAVEGSEVTECSSLACLSSPCHSAATCVEHSENWNCLCPSGYVGSTCELSVCANNPCRYGGTCTEYPGSGFICLCPFGKHGLFCQNDLEIGQPSYRPSVHGLSSYSAYTLPGAIHHSFEIRFRFAAFSLDQVAIMLFIGQENSHDQTSDHLAVSFIKGYVILTWNLGSGPRRIFTPNAVHGKLGSLHTVKLGRAGQHAWLQVDNFENITGSSPGKLTELNTKPVLFIGGHKSANFSGLPHDLPLHSGFAGCIHGVELRTGRVSVRVGQVRTRAVVGRGVGQCGTSHCHNTTCLNGGACLDHGATFTCLCRDGWFGPVCALRHNPCDTNRHNCSDGATCVPLETGYECDCPLGRAGKHCEKEEKLSDVYFSGHRSFMSLPTTELHLHQISLEFEMRPTRDRGLVIFSGQLNSQSFLSISLHGGVLELRLQTLGNRKRTGEVLVIRSGRILSLATWHRVKASRSGRRISLSVDGTVNADILKTGETLIPTDTPLYVGGIPDLSLLPSGAMAGLPVSFSGCMRRLVVNKEDIALDESKALSARNVADCDGTACGGDVCLHGGSCWLDTMLKPHCTCPQEYTGDRCESLVSCTEVPCENGGHCIKETDKQPKCHCLLGWSGPFCTQKVPKGAPHFGGDSYLIIDPGPSTTKRRGISANINQKDIEFLYVNFSTAQLEGIILWTTMDDEFIGIGIENGLLKATWSWSGLESRTVIVPSVIVADGGWHDIAISFTTENITLWSDHGSALTYSNPLHKLVTTDGIIYLGGFPNGISVPIETRGSFVSQFEGCVRELGWNDHATITDFTQFDGENIDSCDFYEM